MQAQFEIPHEILTESLAQSLFKGDLGEKVADRLANLYAEITTYNRTDAAKLLNVARQTLYDYESDGLLTFRKDGRITLASLLEFGRNADLAESVPESVNRRTQKPKKRTVKK